MNNYVLVSVIGKNVNNYIKWLIKKKINVIKLKIIKHDEVNILVDYRYLNVLSEYSKTYKVRIIKRYGYLRILDTFKKNAIIIICFIMAIGFLYFLSGYIFMVDIIYNDYDVTNNLKKELAEYGIKQFARKKNYDYLVSVKEKILANNKDTLEWLEIEESGTKYTVRLVERKKEQRSDGYRYQSIVAKKDAIIHEIKSYSGERIKLVNDYVRRGDVVISGILTRPDGTFIYEKALGKVIGEVWYQVQIDYPLFYQEEKLTGRKRDALAVYFGSNELLMFPYPKYKNFDSNIRVLFEDNFIDFKIAKVKIYETLVKEEIYTTEAAVIKAKEAAIKKLKTGNSAIISVVDIQVLEKEFRSSSVRLNLFISALEDITEVVEVIPEYEKVEN